MRLPLPVIIFQCELLRAVYDNLKGLNWLIRLATPCMQTLPAKDVTSNHIICPGSEVDHWIREKTIVIEPSDALQLYKVQPAQLAAAGQNELIQELSSLQRILDVQLAMQT